MLKVVKVLNGFPDEPSVNTVTADAVSQVLTTEDTFEKEYLFKKPRTMESKESIKYNYPPHKHSDEPHSSERINPEPHTVTTLEGLVLKQVPDHPYLFYNENHAMVHQIFNQIRPNAFQQHQTNNVIFPSAHSLVSVNPPRFY